MLDSDAPDKNDEHRLVKLVFKAYYNCHASRFQPRVENRHMVSMVTRSEDATYDSELDLRQATLAPDSRIAHTLNLHVDEAQSSFAGIAYDRLP